ncbi:MAG: glucose-6-phosphate dehydrogenase [Veillonella caviae]|nr:glucose-6-phosphate dehydrogenase [Veillonella caviae]
MSAGPMTVSYNCREQLCIDTAPGPGAIVIFGASGDLTKRKLLPAIFALYKRNLLPEQFAVVGVARTEMSNEEFQEEVRQSLNGEGSLDESFIERFSYVAGQYTEPDTFARLDEELDRVTGQHGTEHNALFYLAMPPAMFEPIVKGLHEEGLLDETDGWKRVIIEKPFGYDLESAVALDQALKQYIKESQTYRIDHYLGKETVQNILMLRFANSIFEPLWNHTYIEKVEITVAEELGVEKRAGYYDKAGALRDMFQNHMIQMLSLIAMEPPAIFEADAYRDEIAKLISSIRPLEGQDLGHMSVRGQYVESVDPENSALGYRKEEGVAPRSQTETYVALKLFVDNWRWRGVPFYMRTGKRLPKKSSEIAITFKPIPHSIFKPIRPKDFNQNVLLLRMQPHEGMGLSIEVKSPGSKLCVNTLEMDFSYSDFMQGVDIPDAYERLILDALLGDQTLFVRNDTVEASWKLFMPLLNAWEANLDAVPLCFYPSFSEGPKEANEILEGGSLSWRKI